MQELIDILQLSSDPPSEVTVLQHEEMILNRSSIESDTFEKSYHEIVSQIRVFLSQYRTGQISSDNNLGSNVILSHPPSKSTMVVMFDFLRLISLYLQGIITTGWNFTIHSDRLFTTTVA